MNINYNNIVKSLIPFLVLVFIVYLLNTVLWFYLPKNAPNITNTPNSQLKYSKYRVYNSFYKKEKKKKVKKEVVVKKEYELLSNIILKAIYAKNNTYSGWIVLSEKSSPNTHILSVGDKFKSYTLKEVYSRYVIFEKSSKEYKVTLGGEDETFTKKTVVKKITQQADKIEQPQQGVFEVKKELVKSYTGNLEKIFSEISIKEITKNGKIDGFRINSLSSRSIFKKLGLQRGDIIKEVNNIKLNSYNDAFKIYNQMNKLDVLNFKILRNNQIMEIEYEIK